MVRMIIAGSRDFNDFELLNNKIIEIARILREEGYYMKDGNLEIISGTANGADKLGEQFALKHNLLLKRMPADWSNLGRSAGYIRNTKMAEYACKADLGVLIAFWNGSPGTRHMIDIAKDLNIRTFIINF